MALSRVILLLAVGAQVILVSSRDAHRVVDLTRLGETEPEDMLYEDGSSPQPTEVSPELTKDSQLNNRNGSRQFVPQIEFVYDSKGQAWVDQVKQVPDPATTMTREARRADNPRKDILGTEIINDVAYLEVRLGKERTPLPVVSVRRAEESANAEHQDTSRTGKIRYSQIPFERASTFSGPAFEEVQDYPQDDQDGTQSSTAATAIISATTGNTTATGSALTTSTTPPSLFSSSSSPEDSTEELEILAQTPAITKSTEADIISEGTEDEEDVSDYPDNEASSEDLLNQDVATETPASTPVPLTTVEPDYDDEGDGHEAEVYTDSSEAGTKNAVEPEAANPTEFDVENAHDTDKVNETEANVNTNHENSSSEAEENPTASTLTTPASTTIRVPTPRTMKPLAGFPISDGYTTVKHESSPESREDEDEPSDQTGAVEEETGEGSSNSEQPLGHIPGEDIPANQAMENSSSVSVETLTDSITTIPIAALTTETEPQSETTEAITDPREDVSEATTDSLEDVSEATTDHFEDVSEATTIKDEQEETRASSADSPDGTATAKASQFNSSELLDGAIEAATEAVIRTDTGEASTNTTSGGSVQQGGLDAPIRTENNHPSLNKFSQLLPSNPKMFFGIARPPRTTAAPVASSGDNGAPTTSTTQHPSNTTLATTRRPIANTTSDSIITAPTATTRTTPLPPRRSPTPLKSTLPTRDVAVDDKFVLGLEDLFNLSPSSIIKPTPPPLTRANVNRFRSTFESTKERTPTGNAPDTAFSTAIPSFFGNGAPFEMLQFPWSTAESEYSGPEERSGVAGVLPTSATPTVSSAVPLSTTTAAPARNRLNLFSKKVAPTLLTTKAPSTGGSKKFNLFASLTNANNPVDRKGDRRPKLRPFKKLAGPWEASIDPPEGDVAEPDGRGIRPEREPIFGRPPLERRLVLESAPALPSPTRPPPQIHSPNQLHEFAVPPPVDHSSYDMNDFLHRATPATPRNAKTPISLKARTTLLMCAAIIGGAAIFFATLMVVCMKRTKNKRLIRRRAIDKFIQDASSEASSNYGGSHSSYGRKGLLARV